MHSLAISYHLVKNIFLKALFNTKSNDLIYLIHSVFPCFSSGRQNLAATALFESTAGGNFLNAWLRRYLIVLCAVSFLSTHADRQGVDISVTVCVFVCTAEDKSSGVKFSTAVYRRPRQGISHFCELHYPRSPK